MTTDLRAYALAHPVPPGGDVRPFRSVKPMHDGRLVTAALTTEICGCLGPVWHVSVSTQRAGVEMCDDERMAHLIAHGMLEEVGQPERELWWWNAEARIGHLRVHLTNGERLLMGDVVAELPDDHDEPGEWWPRSGPITAGGE